MTAAYYNEIDPFAAAWLRELIKEGLIADGDVDTRSIEDVAPADLREFTQCHFFAGIGVWSYALRRAGWPDDRPVWTASCPCQPFSAAGKGAGFADERHLWPAVHWLAAQCRPVVMLGEQVASKDGLAWLDLVHADLENSGYAVGAVDSCAAGGGAPHIRQRLYWVAHADSELQGSTGIPAWIGVFGRSCEAQFVADAGGAGLEGLDQGAVGAQCQAIERGGGAGGMADAAPEQHDRPWCGRQGRRVEHSDRGATGRVADTSRDRCCTREWDDSASRHRCSVAAEGGPDRHGAARPTDGFWRDADWLLCRDGKWRPVEPGTFPLVTGAPNRVGRLRGYGNAIVAPQAQAFIESVMEVIR